MIDVRIISSHEIARAQFPAVPEAGQVVEVNGGKYVIDQLVWKVEMGVATLVAGVQNL